MWKLIIKNIWSRRKKNGWLLSELILVSVVTWVIMDPVIVLLHDTSLPLGYDADRLCLINVAALDERAPNFDAQETDSAAVVSNFLRLVDKVKSRPEVEQAAPITSFTYFNANGNSSIAFNADTLSQGSNIIYFTPGYHFFETYGIEAVEGSPSAEKLSKGNYSSTDVVVTSNLTDYLLRGENGMGKELYSAYDNDTIYFRITGVVDNIRLYSSWRPSPIVFVANNSIDFNQISESSARILVRLKAGVTPERFLDGFRPWMVKEMKAGNLFARSVKSYEQILKDGEYASGTSNQIRLNIALAIFFLINLCLGVIGTFWLQTRKRSEDAGIMRSFGATPSYILRMLLGEGFVICTFAYLIGCFGYFQYALKEGLYAGETWMPADTNFWVSSFATHFIGVSAIVYLIILVVVSIGIYIPARSISKIEPVDALRNE